jgi:peptidoglycan/xylan/chitin deacetylase (PgdA/CDA1 family)
MLKNRILKLMVKSNAFAPFRFLNRAKTPILMYHRFSKNQEINATSQKTLIDHLKYLTNHYQIIPLAEFNNRLKNNEPIPNNSVVITIDDGYRDCFEIAYPIFREFKVPATLFVVTDFLDGKIWIWTDKARYILLNATGEKIQFEIGDKIIEANLNSKESRFTTAGKINSELKKLSISERDRKIDELAAKLNITVPELPTKDFESMTWSEAVELDKKGVAIESHTVSHPILTNVSDEELSFELKYSREVLNYKLQREISIFCYPNGNVGSRESQAVEKAGYDCAVTTEIRHFEKGENNFLIPRIDAEPEMTRFIQSTSGFDSLKNIFR